MKWWKKTVQYAHKRYDVLSEKKFTTLAGALVFFFILSVVPFSFLLTLIFGNVLPDLQELLNLSVFEGVKDVLVFIQTNAKQAASGVTVFLAITSIYSSTNLFYHMRKSGEIIYGYKRNNKGLKVRLSALILMICIMIILVLFALIFFAVAYLFKKYFQGFLANLSLYLLLFCFCFFVCWILNQYICPYRLHWKNCVLGALLTALLWAGCAVGFSIYLSFTNLSKLYGAVTTVVVFLLWLYLLANCFMIGVIFNAKKIPKEKIEKKF